MVGVNQYQIKEEAPKGLLKVNPEVGRRQISKLVELKSSRDNHKVKQTLEELKQKAATEENLVPYILQCVKAYSTLGEICKVLREVFGEYKPQITLGSVK